MVCREYPNKKHPAPTGQEPGVELESIQRVSLELTNDLIVSHRTKITPDCGVYVFTDEANTTITQCELGSTLVETGGSEPAPNGIDRS